MRERQGCRSASIEGDRGDVGDRHLCSCALGAWTAAVSTVPGDGRRLPARRTSWRAFPPSFGVPMSDQGGVLQMTTVFMTSDAGAPVLLGSVGEPDAIRVLLIEDGAIDRGFLANELSKQGFAVRKLSSLPGAPNAARDADVIVLHCDWAKISSIDLLGKLHRLGINVPIVLLTGEASSAHECLALDERAIDVIGKSRGSKGLARRLKGVVETFG